MGSDADCVSDQAAGLSVAFVVKLCRFGLNFLDEFIALAFLLAEVDFLQDLTLLVAVEEQTEDLTVERVLLVQILNEHADYHIGEGIVFVFGRAGGVVTLAVLIFRVLSELLKRKMVIFRGLFEAAEICVSLVIEVLHRCFLLGFLDRDERDRNLLRGAWERPGLQVVPDEPVRLEGCRHRFVCYHRSENLSGAAGDAVERCTVAEVCLLYCCQI